MNFTQAMIAEAEERLEAQYNWLSVFMQKQRMQQEEARARWELAEAEALRCPHTWGPEYHLHLGHETLGAHGRFRTCLTCGWTYDLNHGKDMLKDLISPTIQAGWTILPNPHHCAAGWRGAVVLNEDFTGSPLPGRRRRVARYAQQFDCPCCQGVRTYPYGCVCSGCTTHPVPCLAGDKRRADAEQQALAWEAAYRRAAQETDGLENSMPLLVSRVVELSRQDRQYWAGRDSRMRAEQEMFVQRSIWRRIWEALSGFWARLTRS